MTAAAAPPKTTCRKASAAGDPLEQLFAAGWTVHGVEAALEHRGCLLRTDEMRDAFWRSIDQGWSTRTALAQAGCVLYE